MGLTDKDRKRINVGQEVAAWWLSQQPPPLGKGKGNPGALARMRRSRTPPEAYMSDPEVRSLHLRLHGEYFDARRAETVGALAAIVAMVRVNDDRSVAKRLATADNPFSFVRFRRLLETNDLADLMYGMRQVVRFLDDRANVADLAWSIYQWNDRDNSQRLRWAYDYG